MVLSVDDDPVNQAVIEFLLEDKNYHLVQAMDGLEALEYLEKADSLPDIVLLDVMMPGLSGYEVCTKIRQLYPASLPIIMISAKCSREDVVQGLACICNDYVTKPFDKEELLARIDAHVKLNCLREIHENEAMKKKVSHLALPRLDSNLNGECFVLSCAMTLGTGREIVIPIAEKHGLITIPTRLDFYYAITRGSESLKPFFVELIESVESNASQAVTIFVSKISNCLTEGFGDVEKGIVQSAFMYGPGFVDHLRLFTITNRGIELPKGFRPSSVVCSSVIATSIVHGADNIKTQANISRIFVASEGIEPVDDPLSVFSVDQAELIPASCGAQPAPTILMNECSKHLNQAIRNLGTSVFESNSVFSPQVEAILQRYDGTNGPEMCSAISQVVDQITAVLRGDNETTKCGFDSLFSNVSKPLREVLLSDLQNERLRSDIDFSEKEYVNLVKSVNQNLSSILQVESLNEMMFLEVQRRVFESSRSTYS